MRIKTAALGIILSLVFFVQHSEAKRHKKFKGVIIVNQILNLTGKITRNGEDAPEFSGVKQGDVLETADKSQAVIRIPGLAILRMGPHTKLKLTQFNERNESRFELMNGDLLALFRRVGDHEVKLNHSVIKLHGTTFYVLSPADSKIDKICLCDGKINVAVKDSRKPQSDSVPVPAPAPSVAGTPIFHSTISAPPTPVPPGVKPGIATPTPIPTPVATPMPTPTVAALPKSVDLVSNNEHKQCDVSDDGVELKPNGKLTDLHTQAEIKDLESLYALP